MLRCYRCCFERFVGVVGFAAVERVVLGLRLELGVLCVADLSFLLGFGLAPWNLLVYAKFRDLAVVAVAWPGCFRRFGRVCVDSVLERRLLVPGGSATRATPRVAVRRRRSKIATTI